MNMKTLNLKKLKLGEKYILSYDNICACVIISDKIYRECYVLEFGILLYSGTYDYDLSSSYINGRHLNQ